MTQIKMKGRSINLNVKRLKEKISQYGGINKLLVNLQKRGVLLSKSSYFRKIRGVTEFTRGEIIGLAEELEMDDNEIFEIFFKQEVS